MKCHDCGTQNPDYVLVCIECGCDLNCDSISEQEIPRGQKKKFIVLGIILTIGCIISFISAALHSARFVIFSAVFPVIFGIKALIDNSINKKPQKGKWLIVTTIITPIVFLPFFLWLSLDASPIPNDYTIADLQSADPQYNHTYDLLLSLSAEEYDPNGAPAIGLGKDDLDMLTKLYEELEDKEHAELAEIIASNNEIVNNLWERSQKGRNVINQLCMSEQIADLTKPSIVESMEDCNISSNLKYLWQINCLYVFLQSINGEHEVAAEKLVDFDLVFRKLGVNARSFITKLICYAIFTKNINAANFIVNNPDTPQDVLNRLEGHFEPLTEQHSSLRNCFIWEYLAFKKDIGTDGKIFEEVDSADSYRKLSQLLKHNSTSRLYRNCCDCWICLDSGRNLPETRLSVWPCAVNWPEVSFDDDDKLPWYYYCYNPIGSMLTRMMMPAVEKVLKIKTKILVRDDLFQIVLAMRMGSEYSLQARAYDDEYIIDLEKKIIYSPGPDGEPFTDDDIKLEINPDVLGLTEQGLNSKKTLTEQK